MKLVVSNPTCPVRELYDQYVAEYECGFERIMAVQFAINDLEIACMVSESEGNIKQLKLLRKVLTRLDNRVMLKAV